MTPLGRRLAGLIAASGPMSVADFMAQCLFDPQDGYYTTREPFGMAGDFVTAPEISQMFGELVGVWVVAAWQAIGSPHRVTVAEIGPGRGTLMKDVLRTLAKIASDLHAAADIALVETSPRLAAIQRATLGLSGEQASWHQSIDSLPDQPVIIVGNEIFDAIPMRQFVKIGMAWRERTVGLDKEGQLRLVAGAASLDKALLPHGAEEAPDGAIVEIAPARSALMCAIASRIAEFSGAGLFFDYGYLDPGLGDTFQAVRQHRPEGVLDNPGEADLTSHVDFSALADAAREAGLETWTTSQGKFLIDLGLLQRAGSLGSNASEAERESIRLAVERLAGPDAMGHLFKVLVTAPHGVAMAPFAHPH